MEVQNTKSPTINTELTNKKNDNMEEQLHLQLSEEEAIDRSLEKDYFHSLNLQKQILVPVPYVFLNHLLP